MKKSSLGGAQVSNKFDAFCVKHYRYYRESEGCPDCLDEQIAQLDQEILADPNIPEVTKELFKALGKQGKQK